MCFLRVSVLAHFSVLAHWLPLVVAAANVDGSSTLGGSHWCPCVDPRNATSLLGQDPNLDMGCAIHDQRRNQTCLLEGPQSESCRQWCYVNPQDCQLSYAFSVVYVGLAFSYSTCGFLGTFGHEAGPSSESLNGMKLRVHYVSNSGGWKGTYCDVGGPGELGTDCHGPLPDLIRVIAQRAQFSLEEVASFHPLVREQAIRLNTSSHFDTCVLAAGMGFVDLCVSLLHKTAARTNWARFVALAVTHTHLIGSAKPQDSLWSRAAKIFAPFDDALWMMLLGVVLIVSGLMLIYEGGDARGDLSWKKGRITAACHTVYLGLSKFLNFPEAHPRNSAEGKITMLGFSALVLLTVTTYTANLASFLVVSHPGASLADIGEAVAKSIPICLIPSETEKMRNLYPSASSLLVTIPKRQDIPAAIEALRCGGAISSVETFEGWMEDLQCDLTISGDALDSSFGGIFVTDSVFRPMDFWMKQALGSGLWTEIKAKNAVKSGCASKNSGRSLSPLELLGPFLISAVFAVLGIVVKFARWLLARQSTHKSCGEARSAEQLSDLSSMVTAQLEARWARVELHQEDIQRRLKANLQSRMRETAPCQCTANCSDEGHPQAPAGLPCPSNRQLRQI